MTKLILTELGRIAAEFGVMTLPTFWRECFRDAEKCVDDDGDVELFFDERIAGLTELKARFYAVLADAESGRSV